MAIDQTNRRVRPANPKAIPEKLQELARVTFKANRAKNAHTKEEADTRKDLYKGMKDAGITKFQTTAILDGKRVTLEADISTPPRVEVDVTVLRKLVDEATFLAIVGASQTSVKEHAGEAILRRCSSTTNGTENVSVKASK